MPRRTAQKVTQVVVRLESGVLERIDAVIPKIATTWHEPTRSDVVRAALVAGLASIEAEAEKMAQSGIGKPKRRG